MFLIFATANRWNSTLMRRYKYLGDRLTAPELKGAICYAVMVEGKCIRRGASMLVSFGNKKHIVLARLLRKQNHDEKPS